MKMPEGKKKKANFKIGRLLAIAFELKLKSNRNVPKILSG